MKIRTIFFTVLMGLWPCLTQAESSTVISELNRIAENGGSKATLEKWHQLSLDQQALAIETVIQKLQIIGRDARPVKFNSTDYVSSAAWLLSQVGTDEQIISAFGNLSGFGNVEPDAARALASCKSSAGVEIIEKLAEKRLPELESAINPKNEDERARVSDILIPFYFLLVRLEAATNPEGSRAAKRLRDQVAARYLSESGKSFVAVPEHKRLPVIVRFENILPAVATRHHVVNRTGILESQGSGHTKHILHPTETGKIFVFSRGLTPLMTKLV